MAVVVATQLIAGFYVGLDCGAGAVVACLANAAMDKVAFCRSYGVDIQPEQWPSQGLPGEIITDKGREFTGGRVDELCIRYGLERETLPPFRPDGKGLVEKAFDLIQERYKPLLRGKGVIEADAQERWAVDYRSQATLDLSEFTRVLIHCIIYLNGHRVLQKYIPCPEMAAAGVEPIPAHLWRWYEDMGRSLLIPVGEEEARQLTMQRKTTKLTRRGVNHDGLWYVCGDYQTYLQEYGVDKEVVIAYDTERIDLIYLLHDNRYIPCTLAPYCAQYLGLSLLEYELFRDKSKRQRKDLRQQETEARAAVMRSINEIVEEIDAPDKQRQQGPDIRRNREEERRRRT